MNTSKTSNKSQQLSAIRDHVVVSEIPVINTTIRMPTNKRVLNAKKVGISDKAISSLPEHIHTKLDQTLLPTAATRQLDSIRKNVKDFLDRRAVHNKHFGFIVGHETAVEVEDWLFGKRDEFNAAILSEKTYNDECNRIIEALRSDPILKEQDWHASLVDASLRAQPSYEQYIESCEFEVYATYIGESGLSDTRKLRSAEDTFQSICKGTKGSLIEEISTTANKLLTKAHASPKDKGIKEVSWKLMYALCDKLSDLSFVSKNIGAAEEELRTMLDSKLPSAGTLHGMERENFLVVLSALVDPFALADKVDSGLPLFKKSEDTLGESLFDSLKSEAALDGSATDKPVEVSVSTKVETNVEAASGKTSGKPSEVVDVIEDLQSESSIESKSNQEDSSLEIKADAIEQLIADADSKIEPKTTSADDFINESANKVFEVVDATKASTDELMSTLGF